MIDKPKLRQQLDVYAKLLITSLDHHGYVPEFITGEASELINTRLLCQTRSIFFLIDYAEITQNNLYLDYAQQLAKLIIKEYFCTDQQRFYQYPTSVSNQTTAADKMLYELAFVICSLAKLYKVTHNENLVHYIMSTKNYVFEHYYNQHNQFSSMLNPITGVNQNSFMHLFEALLEANSVINNSELLHDFQQFGTDLLNTIFDNKYNLIRENSNVEIFEPGHSFEWASLILEAKQKNLFSTAIDYTNIVTNAENCGVNNHGLVYAEIKPDQPPSENAFRIWPLLEQIRFYAMINSTDKLAASLNVLNNVFFSTQNLPYEYVNANLEPQQVQVKSTTGYHIINCYKYILK